MAGPHLTFVSLSPHSVPPDFASNGMGLIGLYSCLVSREGRPTHAQISPGGNRTIPVGWRMEVNRDTKYDFCGAYFAFIVAPSIATHGIFSPPILNWEQEEGMEVPLFHCGLIRQNLTHGAFLGHLVVMSAERYTVEVMP